MKRTEWLRATWLRLVMPCVCAGAMLLGAGSMSGIGLAASPKQVGIVAKPAAGHETVELFKAMEDGDIEVTLIGKSSKEANIIIKNKTKKPLSVKLPEAFAGIPVNAQMMGGGMGGMGGGGMGGMGGGGMGGGQGMGGGMGGGGMGGMGGGGMGGGGMGGGGGFFNVAAEKVRKFGVDVVCLEEGKPDPTPRMAYRIVPIESFTKKPEVIELCKMIGRREIPQNTAQAVAWHLASGLTWEDLAVKDKMRSATTGLSQKYFTPQEIQVAIQVAGEATRRADAQAKETTPATSASSAGDQQASLSSNKLGR